jgi:hypothetical protein
MGEGGREWMEGEKVQKGKKSSESKIHDLDKNFPDKLENGILRKNIYLL